ncbi:hypothetical protein RhoFasB10_01963 [Rhodococcus sp. B10]|nr:hypothetical protein [Rhodococcus sp. B10]
MDIAHYRGKWNERESGEISEGVGAKTDLGVPARAATSTPAGNQSQTGGAALRASRTAR